MVYNEKIKEHIYKWRENNREAYNAYVGSQIALSYERDPDKHRRWRMESYYRTKNRSIYETECISFRKLLVNLYFDKTI